MIAEVDEDHYSSVLSTDCLLFREDTACSGYAEADDHSREIRDDFSLGVSLLLITLMLGRK